MAHLEAIGLGKTFLTPGGRIVEALRDVSFVLEQGQVLSIVGSNGAGKSSLLNCIRGAYPYDGKILLDGEPLDPLRRRVVTVFQEVSQGIVGSMTTMENLSLAYSMSTPFLFTFPKARYSSRIIAFLNDMRLAERFKAFDGIPLSELSGGQRQQVAIALAMMRRPAVLLLDEFVANLDPTVRQETLAWVKDWIRAHKVTTLMVTHDHSLAETWGDMVLELRDGVITRFSKAAGSSPEVAA